LTALKPGLRAPPGNRLDDFDLEEDDPLGPALAGGTDRAAHVVDALQLVRAPVVLEPT
jgi:hypothetical protein